MKPEARPFVVVTGAAGGIGLAVVRRLLAEGRRLLALDIDVAALAPLADEALRVRQMDVSDEEELRAAVAEAGAEAGLEALVCCAAIFPAAPVAAITPENWDEVFAVNVEGVVAACQAALPFLRASRGSIVLFSSAMARTGGVHAVHYAASKGAILGFARSLALDVAAEGVRVNTVSPGLTDTAQPRGNMSEAELFARAARTPMGRPGRPEEMAELVSFLIGPDASFITGQDLRATGGAALF